MITLGVIADTHIPDRVAHLNPQVIEVFQQAKVSAILYAVDVIIPQVLEELGKVTPVHAVRGNRDIFYLRKLPLRIELNMDGVVIGMAHGHHSLQHYMVDKIHLAVKGWSADRYIKRMWLAFPQADVIVFGHLHLVCAQTMEGKLLFNPGSASLRTPKGEPATIGLLHIDTSKQVRGEIIKLDDIK